MKFTVHGAHEEIFELPVTSPQGFSITAALPVLAVELVPLDPWGKSYTHRIPIPATTDAEKKFREEQLAKYQPGVTVEVAEPVLVAAAPKGKGTKE